MAVRRQRATTSKEIMEKDINIAIQKAKTRFRHNKYFISFNTLFKIPIILLVLIQKMIKQLEKKFIIKNGYSMKKIKNGKTRYKLP